MPFPYQIGGAEFVQWRGPQPGTPRYSATGHTRPGVAGVAFHQFWAGVPFSVELESWHTNMTQAALAFLDWQTNYQGKSHNVIYGGVDWTNAVGVQFFVSDIQEGPLRVFARVTGFGVDAENAAVMLTRWTLTPKL